jgi:hypothetical protein
MTFSSRNLCPRSKSAYLNWAGAIDVYVVKAESAVAV